MPTYDPFDDPVLGRMTWNDERKEWQFSITLPSGRSIRSTVKPEDHRLPLQQQGLDEVRECLCWVRDNEPTIRQYITDQMFDDWLSNWYDEEIDTVTTREQFREAISLAGIDVLEDRIASLSYKDGGLFGGHAIVLSVGVGGRFEDTPDIWG